MRIAVIGANGQLGSELCRRIDGAVPLTRKECDLGSDASIESSIRRASVDAVINAAAYTQVDRAESEPALCRRINSDAVGVIAQVCQALSVPLVHISTDYVFGADGKADRPLTEMDVPQPRGVYAQTKLAGERLAAACEKHFIVRTCGLYSFAAGGPHKGRNFVDTMLALGRERDCLQIVADQTCTPTYVPHLARAIAWLAATTEYGLFHIVNGGQTTWYDFAAEVFRRANYDVALTPITTAQYGAPAPRPRYSVLATGKYLATGGPAMPTWKEGLSEYFETAASCSGD